jgi:two-component system, chemotaxis family, chemotaxis protein CheY
MSPLVLVVDDDPDILDAICDILEVERYRVARARNGVEALERVEAERPDVILLDLMMPVMDGVTFARVLHGRPGVNDVPILVISADGNPARAASVGARGYLAKPFDIDTLLGHVSAIAGRTAPGGEPRMGV